MQQKVVRRSQRNIHILLLALLAVATLFFHFWHVADIPFGINNDAAWEGSAARAIIQGNWKDYVPFAAAWHGEPMVRLLVVAFTPLIGNTPTAIKLASVLLGILLIPFIFLFLRKLFDWRISFLTTWFIATSGWHLVLSRSGWRAVAVPTVTVLVLFALVKLLETRKEVWSVIGGISLALTLYTYDAARIVPFIVFCAVCVAFILKKNMRKAYGRLFVLYFAWFLITASPMLLYALQHWDIFIGRTTYLLITNQIIKTRSLTPIWTNIVRTAGMFVYRAGGNDFFVKEPLLDFPSIWLFPLGLCIGLWQIVRRRDKIILFMFLWFLAGILPALLSDPNGNRAIGALPSVYFFVANGAMTGTAWLSKSARQYQKTIQLLFLVYLSLLAAGVTYVTYLSPVRRQPEGFRPETLIVAQYLRTKQSSYDLYLTDNFPREILTYILYRNGDPFKANYTWFQNKESFLSVHPHGRNGIMFVLFPTDENQAFSTILMEKYSTARRYTLPLSLGDLKNDAALVVEVPPSTTSATH